MNTKRYDPTQKPDRTISIQSNTYKIASKKKILASTIQFSNNTRTPTTNHTHKGKAGHKNPSRNNHAYRMLFQTPNNRTMIAAAPRERAGGASGMLGTARLLGQTTGAALVALLLGRYPVDGTRIALLTGVGFALCGAVLSMLRLSTAGARGAEHVRVRDDQRLRGE